MVLSMPVCMCDSARQHAHLAIAIALHHALAERVVPQPLLQARAICAGVIEAAAGLLAADGAWDVPDEVSRLCQPLADAPLQARQEGAALMCWQEARACIPGVSLRQQYSKRDGLQASIVLRWCPGSC